MLMWSVKDFILCGWGLAFSGGFRSCVGGVRKGVLATSKEGIVTFSRSPLKFLMFSSLLPMAFNKTSINWLGCPHCNIVVTEDTVLVTLGWVSSWIGKPRIHLTEAVLCPSPASLLCSVSYSPWSS